MKAFFTVILVLLGEFLCCQALNTTLRGSWQDQSLPTSAGLRYNDVWGYASDDGREYAIIGSLNFTHFIDVTNPESPVEVHRESDPNSCIWRDFKTYGHYAYGVAEFCNAGLEIYDLSTLPNPPIKVYDSNEFFTNAHNVWIDTTTARLHAVGLTDGNDMITLDLSQNPQNPTLVAEISFLDYGYVHDIHVVNNIAYTSHGSDRLLVIYNLDASTGQPTVISQIPSNGFNHSSWVTPDGSGIVMADETSNAPLIFADISDIENPVETATIKSTLLGPNGSIAHNPFIVGDDFVAVAYYDDGLQIYNMDDLGNPFLAGYYDTDTITTVYRADGAWGTYPYLPSGNIINSDILFGLTVVQPSFPLRDCLSDVDVSGAYDNEWELISKDRLTNSASYADNASLTIRAPDYVSGAPDFMIELGSTLEVYIEDLCNQALRSKDSNKEVIMIESLEDQEVDKK